MLEVVKAIALAAALAVILGAGRAHACDEVSDVTGYRRCSSFGHGWDESPAGQGRATPAVQRRLQPLPLFVEAAAVMQTLDAGSTTFSGTAADSHSFSLHNRSLGAAVVYGVDLRAGLRVAGPFYVGVATRFAFGGLSERTTAVADGVRVDLGGVLGAVAIGGLVGFARPLSSRVRVRLEAAVGVEDLGLLAIGGIACSASPCGPDSLRAFVEPHVVMDLWLGRSWSVSPFAGDDVLHLSSVTLGVMSSWHWQAFDGLR
jgi:uncharacterized membrane protein (Fun14 family)